VLQTVRQIVSKLLLRANFVDLKSQVDDVLAVIAASLHVIRHAPFRAQAELLGLRVRPFKLLAFNAAQHPSDPIQEANSKFS